MILARRLFLAALAAVGLLGTQAALAQEGFDAQVSLRATHAQRNVYEGDDIDGSGFGARYEIGYNFSSDVNQFRLEADATVFDYSDSARKTRESIGGRASYEHKLSEVVSVTLEARLVEDIPVLESREADHRSVRVTVELRQGRERLRMHAEYRHREYADDVAGSSDGDGVRVGAEWRHSIASYHWFEIEAVHEDMDSDDPLRGFHRVTAIAQYSLPVERSTHLRVRPRVQYRAWTYDDLIARGDPQGDRRHDRVLAPGIDLAAGRDSRGLYALARSSYELRKSNDIRHGKDSLRLDFTLGYRF